MVYDVRTSTLLLAVQLSSAKLMLTMSWGLGHVRSFETTLKQETTPVSAFVQRIP